MGEFDIEPPTPPKFFEKQKEKKKEENTVVSQLVDNSIELKKEPSESKSLFSIFSRKKAVSEKQDEEFDIDLDKIRAQYKIPPPKDKPSKKSSVESIGWTEGDIVDELSASKERNVRWDVEDPDHLKEPIAIPVPISKNFKEEKVQKKDSEVDVSKIPSKKRKVELKVSKKQKGPVDKMIAQYFKNVEFEQELIKKELEKIVADPKKALKKKPNNYLIHHNERLIKSMKHLLAAVKSIEDVKFEKSLQGNKKKFENWINKILVLEKKAEQQRNFVLQKKIGELFEAYAEGLNKDIFDKKYELSNDKRESDAMIKRAQLYDSKLKSFHERLKSLKESVDEKKKNLNKHIEDGIKKQIPKWVKKEKKSLQETENDLKKLIDEYTSKSTKLKDGIEKFEKRKSESEALLKQADSLKRLKSQLEKKDSKLKTEVDNLTNRESELKQKIELLEKNEKELSKKNKSLNLEINKLEAKDQQLLQREQELKIELKDFETRRKEFELREKEITEMEQYLAADKSHLSKYEQDLHSRDEATAYKWQEVEDMAKRFEKDVNDEEQLESQLKGLVDEYTEQASNLKIEETEFEKRKLDAERMLSEGELLKKYKHRLDKKDSKLRKLNEKLLAKDLEASRKLQDAKSVVEDIRREELKLMDEESKIGISFTHYLRDHADEILKPAHPDEKVEDFNRKILLCKEMIVNNQFDDAKKLYSTLRDDFFKSQFRPADKEDMYNSLRELYDDIFLGIISLQ